jgi:DNA-binding IclR family transcriptional regulator
MSPQKKQWSLLSRHGQALVLLAKNPELRVVDLARLMGISERSARLLITSLNRSKILQVHKAGRNNTYQIDFGLELPNEMERSISLKTIVDLAGDFQRAQVSDK